MRSLCTDFEYAFLSYQISQRVFEIVRSEISSATLSTDGMMISDLDASKGNFEKEDGPSAGIYLDKTDGKNNLFANKDDKTKSVPFESYKRRATAFVRREKFLDIVCDALTEYKYVGPNQRADLILACRYMSFHFVL